MSATTTVTAVLDVKDNTKGGLASAGSGISNFGSIAAKVGGILAGAFAVDKIVDFGKSSFAAFEQSEAAMARVSATLKAMGGSASDALPKINAIAQANIKMGFDDEDTAESVTKLYQRTGDLTKAQNLNALAMDLARAKSIDLGTATTLISQILSGGGAKALKDYGIAVSSTSDPLKTLAELQQQVGGQAAAAANTSKVQMEALSITITNFKEQVGGAISSGLQPLLAKIIEIVSDPRFQQFLNDVAKVITTVLVVAINGLITVVSDVSNALIELADWFGRNKTAIEEVTAVITAGLLPLALVTLYEYITITLIPGITAFATTLITETIPAVIAFGVALMANPIFIIGLLVAAVTALVIVIATHWTEIKAETIKIWTEIKDFFTGLWDGIKADFDAVYNWIMSKIDAVVSAYNKVKSVASSIGNGVVSAVSSVFRAQGGSVNPNRPYVVGENGPEMFVPSGYGSISPNGSMGSTININIGGNTFMGKEGIAEQIGDEIINALQLRIKLN